MKITMMIIIILSLWITNDVWCKETYRNECLTEQQDNELQEALEIQKKKYDEAMEHLYNNY